MDNGILKYPSKKITNVDKTPTMTVLPPIFIINKKIFKKTYSSYTNTLSIKVNIFSLEKF